MRVTPLQLPIKRGAIIRNIAYLFSGTTLSQGLTAIALILTARQLGPESYGQYSASIVLMGIASIFYNFGLNVWFIHESNRQPERLSNYLGSALAIKIAFGVVWVLAVFALSEIYHSSVFPKDLLRLTALAVFLDNLFLTLLTAFMASLRNYLTSIFLTISDAVWVILTIYLVGRGHRQASDFMLMRGGVMLFSVVIAGFFVYHWYQPKINLGTLKQALQQTLSYAVSEFLTMSAMRIDLLIVAFYLGETAAGLYSPAVSLVNALFLPISAISGVFLPVLSSLFAKNISQAWKTAIRSFWLHAGAGAFLTLGVVAGAKYLVAFLGSRFSGSLEIIHILSSIIFIHALIFALTNILIATGQQGRRALLQLIAVVLNVILNVAVVKIAGIRGVAIVYLLTEIFLLLTYATAVIRNYPRGLPIHA